MLVDEPRVVLTGATGGLGRALAERLAARRASVLLSDIDEGALGEVAEFVSRGGGKALTAVCDVAKASEVAALRERAEKDLGGVDLVINNAGVAVGGQIGAIPLEDWDWIMGVNLWGVIYGCHEFVPLMRRQGTGHVLNVASIAGMIHGPEMGPYNATKAAVVALSETLYGELRGSGVGLTVRCPYCFKTNIHRAARATPHTIEKLMTKSPVQASEVAELALVACKRDELHCLPHREAKAMSAIKRLSPTLLYDVLMPRVEKLMQRGE